VNCFVWNAHWKKPLTGRGKYTMQEREMDTKKVMMMRIGHNAEISVSEQRASRLYGLVMTFYYGKSND